MKSIRASRGILPRTKVNLDPKQSQMLEYVQPTTRDALLLKELSTQRAASVAEIRAGLTAQPTQALLLSSSPLESPTFGRPAYKESIKKFAYYEYATAGRKAYRTLEANFGKNCKLPCLSTVKNYGSGQPCVAEGELQVECIKKALIARGLPLDVWVSEDDTKLASVLKYASKSNDIIGLDLPIGENGLPLTGAFKFTTLKTAMMHVNSNPMSSYLKIVVCRPLQKDAYKFLLLAYGTSAGGPGGQTEGVKARWETIRDALESVGIKVHGKHQ